MSVNRVKSKKGLLFFLAAIVAVVIVMIIANFRSKIIIELDVPHRGVRKLFTSGDSLVAISPRSEIYLWDWNNLSAKPRKGRVQAQDVTWMKPGRLVWSALPKADTLSVTNLKADKIYAKIPLDPGWKCKILRTSQNGRFTAVGLVDSSTKKGPGQENASRRIGVELLDMNLQKVAVVAIAGGQEGNLVLSNVAVSEDGKFLAAVGSENAGWAAVVDVKQAKLLWEKKIEQTARISNVAFSPDGKTVYMGGDGMIVYGFETVTANPLHELLLKEKEGAWSSTAGQHNGITSIEFSSDGRLILTAGTYTKIHIWNAATGRELKQFSHGGWTIVDFAMSPDHRQFATGDLWALSKVKLWRLPTVR